MGLKNLHGSVENTQAKVLNVSYLFMLCYVCVCVCIHVPHSTCEGQSTARGGSVLSFHSRRLWGLNSVPQVWQKAPSSPLSHLVSPQVKALKTLQLPASHLVTRHPF